jgi:two-component system, LuxR family, sensor kinase FixL
MVIAVTLLVVLQAAMIAALVAGYRRSLAKVAQQQPELSVPSIPPAAPPESNRDPRELHDLAHANVRVEMGELLSAVTHELNQPITASLVNAQSLRRMLDDEQAPRAELVEVADDIYKANQRAADLISRIRVQLRKEAFALEPLHLNQLVAEVVQIVKPSAANDGVHLSVTLAPELPAVAGDRVQLRQVVMNLILNALQAVRTTGAVPATVHVTTAAQSGQVMLAVEDTGPGVKLDELPRLFEPYFTTKEDGLGIGLSISRSIVEAHGGRIEIVNRPQGGARVSVVLPVQ